jgi:hypothetical protein
MDGGRAEGAAAVSRICVIRAIRVPSICVIRVIRVPSQRIRARF